MIINNNLRKSGIEIIGDVPWGSHFCQFYQTKQDLLDILVPYFKAGFEHNELCVWVTSDFLNTKEAFDALQRSIPQFMDYLKKGQIEIFPHTEWYLKGGVFEMKRVLKDWVDKHDKALKKGYNGMRVSGNPFWIDNKKDWNDFREYEAEINKVIDSYKLIVLCTYSLLKCGSNEVVDVVSNHEFALIKRDGRWETIESVGHKIMESSLRQSEKRYRSFIALTDQLGWTTNPSGEVIEDMPEWRKYTGQKFDEIKGWGWSKALHPDDLKYTIKAWEKALRDKSKYKVEYRIRKHDSTYKYFLATGIPVFNEKGNIREWVGTCIDITEQKKVEKKLQKLDEQKNEFISIASHELKTPLTTIKAFTQILLNKNKKAEDKQNLYILKNINERIERLTNLINDLLDVSKIQAEKLVFNKSIFSLNDLINKVIMFFQYSNKDFKIIKKSKVKVRINADEERIEQVLVNFISNAIKYSSNQKKIFIKVTKTNNKVIVSVQDFGIGISQENQKKIFKKFVRVNERKIRDIQGFGLGLYISSEIITRHNGKLWVKSKIGKGSTFFFTLPIK